VAVGVGPKELRETAELMLFLLDQDGPEPDDTERARKRGVTVAQQGRDAMTSVTANLNPEAKAVWEVLFAKFAAPGVCNPDDDEPCTSGTPTQAQIDNDQRTLAQRQHDAMIVVGRIALMSGDLGQLNGLPVSIIIRTTLQDLESRAGIAVTGGGTQNAHQRRHPDGRARQPPSRGREGEQQKDDGKCAERSHQRCERWPGDELAPRKTCGRATFLVL
jgi:hypothetical protein